MAMKKVVAVFLMCMFVMTAMHANKAEARAIDQYKNCFDTCFNECFQDGKGNGYTFCEMKCDDDCGVKEIKGI